MPELLCKRCDVFVGYGAAGVVRPPDEDEGWLRSHCWVCRRHRIEVERDQGGGSEPGAETRFLGAFAAHDGSECEGPQGPVAPEQERDIRKLTSVPPRTGYAAMRLSDPRGHRPFRPGPDPDADHAAGDRKVDEAREPSKEVSTYVDKAMFDAEPERALDRPRVHLLSATPDPLGAVAAFAMMYEGRVVRDLAEITDEERRRYFDECFKTALKTPLEAIDLHFMVEGLTRASWDQMRTQRTAVFAGESLRFAVKPDLKESVRRGPMVRERQDRAAWDAAIDAVNEAYHYLIGSGIPAEDARGLLPMNVLTRGHWKTNLRNLEAEIGKRLCTQAQFEWRLIHADLRRSIREYRPTGLAVPGSPSRPNGVRWQWEYIADSPMFVPICFQKGACMFKSQADRGCTIRERVDRGAFSEIRPEEWMLDPTAAWVR